MKSLYAPLLAAAAISLAVPVFAQPGVRWSEADVSQLLDAIKTSASEGLNPIEYDAAAIRAAATSGDPVKLDSAADAAIARLSRDYQFGRVTDKAGFQWYIDRPAADTQVLAEGLEAALRDDRVGPWLQSLLPQTRHYAATRVGYLAATDKATKDRMRANMERWRWMPRTLGTDYVYVNVPTYRLWLVEGGKIVHQHDVIVGAKKTPTPQLSYPAGNIVVNPSWYVPASIVKEAGLRPGSKGYEAKQAADGSWSFRQPPGRTNSLGRVKINLPNPHAIYLHDTPAKGLFLKKQRALSHGCIRVRDVNVLAERMARPATPAFQAAYRQNSTRTIQLAKPWPVHIVYFTVEADPDGKLLTLPDPYGRDAQVVAALDAPRVAPAPLSEKVSDPAKDENDTDAAILN